MAVMQATSGRRQRGQLGDLAGAAHAHLDHRDLGARPPAPAATSGTPISVFMLPGRALRPGAGRAASIATRMSLVVVLPVDPVMATTLRAQPLQGQAAGGLEHGQRVLGHDAPAGGCRSTSPSIHRQADSPTTAAAAPARRASGAWCPPSARSPRRPTNRLPGATSRESTPRALDLGGRASRLGSRAPGATLKMSLTREPHAPTPRAEQPRAPPHGRRTGSPRRCAPGPRSWPLPATTTTSPAAAAPDSASPMAARRSGSTTSSARPVGGAGHDLGDDRLGVLGARVVRGDDGHVGERPRRWRPSAGACRGRGRRRSRTPRSAGPRRPARGPRAARCRASRACGRSRRAPGTAGRPRPARSARAPPARAAMPAATAACVEPQAARPRPPRR